MKGGGAISMPSAVLGRRHGPIDALAAGLVASAAAYLALGELLTYVETSWGVSLNLVFSILITAVATLVGLLQRSWLVLVLLLGIVLVIFPPGLFAGNDLRHLQYVSPSVTFVMVAFMVLDPKRIRATRLWMLTGALLGLPVWTLTWLISGIPLQRASAPVVVVAVVVLLFFSKNSHQLIQVGSLVSVLFLLSYLFLTTARMASALAVTVVLIWLWTLSDWLPRAKGLISGFLLLLSSLYWFGGSWQRERLFGRDPSIGIGPIALNGEGRREGAEIALDSQSAPGVPHLFFGHGGGTSGQRLVDAGFVLDKPHNEFVRVFIDGGLVGVLALLILIAVPLSVGFTNFKWTRDRSLLFLPAVVSIIVFGFALTDNGLSYMWLMLPAGVLVSWSRSNRLASRTPGIPNMDEFERGG